MHLLRRPALSDAGRRDSVAGRSVEVVPEAIGRGRTRGVDGDLAERATAMAMAVAALTLSLVYKRESLTLLRLRLWQ